MDIILNDIIYTTPTEIISWEKPYKDNDTSREKFRNIQRGYRRSKTLKNRMGMLINAYFAGELLDSLEYDEYRRVRTLWTPYYLKIAKRTFILFNGIRINQLYRTQVTTIKMLERLRSEDVLTLISRAKLFLTTLETKVGGGLLPDLISPTAQPTIDDPWSPTDLPLDDPPQI
jgi:hypothetical protein